MSQKSLHSQYGQRKAGCGLGGTRKIMAGGQTPRNRGDMIDPFKPIALQGKWEFGLCRDCGTKVWRKSWAMMRVNKEQMCCKDCKRASQVEVHAACVALALRKQAMGLIK